MRKYKISEFSKLMGVTNDLVKHYQDTGIVSPEVNDANKYRFYTIRHGERIVASRRFREIGFGLQDTKELLHEKDTAGVQDMLKQKQKENEQIIRMMQIKNDCLIEMQQEYASLLSKVGTFELIEVPAYYYVPHVFGQDFNENEVVVERIRDWMEHLECAYKCYMVPKLKDQNAYTDRSIGFIMKETYFKALGFDACSAYTYLPAEKHLVYYYREKYDKQLRFSNEGVEVLKIAQTQGYEINPDYFIMQHLFDDHKDGERYTNYIIHFFLK